MTKFSGGEKSILVLQRMLGAPSRLCCHAQLKSNSKFVRHDCPAEEVGKRTGQFEESNQPT